mmetsp:Transcript_4226/g.3551  ORF Transcript_4226/g.3551 Transcript_4226/m.3551 type:complete len:103 (+) Transcript_4226:352-660(+)
MSDTKMKAISLVSDVLILIQGLYGVYCTAKNSRTIIRRLIITTIWISVAHIFLIIIKLILSSTYVEKYNWREAESEETISQEDIEEMEYFIYGLIISTFFLS